MWRSSGDAMLLTAAYCAGYPDPCSQTHAYVPARANHQLLAPPYACTYISMQVVKMLRFNGTKVPPEYESRFQLVLWAFRHARVYCPAGKVRKARHGRGDARRAGHCRARESRAGQGWARLGKAGQGRDPTGAVCILKCMQ